MLKCRFSYACHSCWNFYTCQTAAMLKCTHPYACHSCWNFYTCQTIAFLKCTHPYARHSCWNLDTCQAAAIPKRIIPYARHSFTINLSRNHKLCFIACISCNGYSAILVFFIVETIICPFFRLCSHTHSTAQQYTKYQTYTCINQAFYLLSYHFHMPSSFLFFPISIVSFLLPAYVFFFPSPHIDFLQTLVPLFSLLSMI